MTFDVLRLTSWHHRRAYLIADMVFYRAALAVTPVHLRPLYEASSRRSRIIANEYSSCASVSRSSSVVTSAVG